MKPVLKNIDFKWFPIGLIIVYVPFHILEEALNNFPFWMAEHYGLPKPLTYPHWFINNSIFLSVLCIGLTIYYRSKITRLDFGVGILIWAFMNSSEHIIFSIFDLKVSPGFYTALLFLLISVIGIMKLGSEKILKPALLFRSILIAFGYWVVSFIIIISLGFYLVKLFPL